MFWCVALPAWAQRAAGPFAGLFGGNQGEAKDRMQGLDFNGSAFGVYNANLPASSDVPLDPRYHDSGMAEGLNGSLTYTRQTEGMRFGASGSGSLMNYSSDSGLLGGIGGYAVLSTDITPKIVFGARGSISYAPFYQFAPFVQNGVATIPPPTFGLASGGFKNFGVDGGVSLTDRFTKRTSGSFDASVQNWIFPDNRQSDLLTWGMHGFLTHRLTRTLGLHAGYARYITEYNYNATTPGNVVSQEFEGGVDYGDTLVFSRRTALSFGVSTSAIHYQDATHFRVNGSVALTRALGRTWSGAISYNRATDYTPGFVGPLLSDSVFVSLGGQLSTRTQWTNSAGYTRGTVGFQSAYFTSYGASTKLTFAITRQVGAYAQYFIYHYDVPSGSTTLTLAPALTRHGVAGGLTVWIPIINDKRAPRDSR
jgi:hypothetical protein